MLLALDERLRIHAGQFAQGAKEVRSGKKPDRCLQIRTVKFLAELAAEFTVHANIYIGLGKTCYVLDVSTDREGEIDFASNTLDQAANFREVGRHVESAVDRTDDIDARLGPFSANVGFRLCPLGPEFGPQPVDRPVGRLPLILVNRPRNEPQKVRPLGVTPPPIISAMLPVTTTAGISGSCVDGGTTHRVFGAVPGQFLLGQPRDDHWKFVRRQRVGVVQYRGDRQVLAADRPVDHDPQAADRGERVDRAPVSASPVVIQNQHRVSSPPPGPPWLSPRVRGGRRSFAPGGSLGISFQP